MNDRHRTIERYKKKCNVKSNYFLNNLEITVKRAINVITNAAIETVKFINDFLKNIRTMPEDELQDFISERPELTTEQIVLIYKIRGDSKK